MWNSVAIIGVGLIGGSLGLALRRRGLAREVVGIGRSASRLQTARDLGAVTRFTTEIAAGVAAADVTVVCTPVGQIVDHVRQVSRHCPADALITDAGSTKGEICRALSAGLPAGGWFVGSHPMAGSEKSGAEFGDADLFEGRVTVVTPTSDCREPHIAAVSDFWRSVGARVVRMTPDEHDRSVAEVSHLPHLVAAVLAATIDPRYLPLAAKGYRDTTRVAAGDVDLWMQIFAGNRPHVLQSLAGFEKVLTAFRQALEAHDTGAARRILEIGKQHRDSLGS